jgi:hypothetical protein
MSDYSPYQVDVLNAIGTLGACVQIALVILGVLAGVALVKALW